MRALLLLLAFGVAHAADVPQGEIDSRVQRSDYQAGQVYEVYAAVGVSTWVIFDEGETITLVDPGFDAGWILTPVDNVLSIKPQPVNGVEPTAQWRTNINVLTSTGRRYSLDAMLVEGRDKLTRVAYTVQFQYPDEQQAIAKAAHTAAEERTEAAIPKPMNCNNMNYGKKPGKSWKRIDPEEICDDGDRMYISFAPGKSLPTFYRVDADCIGQDPMPDGCETIANPVADPTRPGTYMIRPLAEHLMLRSNPSVILVTNTNYQPIRGTP